MKTAELAPVVEAGVLALAQALLVGLLGAAPLTAVVTAFLPAYLISVRWADVRLLRREDVALVLAFLALFSVPLGVLTSVSVVGLQLVATALGIGMARIQFIPAEVQSDAVGIEAHLARVRKEGIERDDGRAERATFSKGDLDPLGGLFGGGAAPKPVEDPYENSKAMHIDPERDL